MWISHKTKEGDTLASIVKQYKVKDAKAILKHPKNKAVAQKLSKKEPLSSGLTVWVPDPKTKVYVVYDTRGKKHILTKKEFETYEKQAHAAMDTVLSTIETRYFNVYEYHMGHRHHIVEHWFVSTYVEAFNRVKEPKNHQKIAYDGVKRLTKAVKGRKYGTFEKEAIYAENMIVKYHHATSDWIEGSIGSGENIVTVLEGVKAVGLFCAGLAAVTVAAPATLTSGILFGAGTAVTFGLTYDGADAFGRGLVGTKQMSGTEWTTRALSNAVSGAAGGALSGGILTKATKPLIGRVLSSKAVRDWATRAALNKYANKIFQRELQILATQVVKKVDAGTAKQVIEVMGAQKLIEPILIKFINKVGLTSLNKILHNAPVVADKVHKWVKENPKKVAGPDGKKVGEAAATDLATPALIDELLNNVLKSNLGAFQKEVRSALQKPAADAEKKLLAQKR